MGLAVRSELTGPDAQTQPNTPSDSSGPGSARLFAAHRVLFLVEGTTTSKVDPLGEVTRMSDNSFKVTSPGVKCLLSEKETYVDLVGYCDSNAMLAYRLDKDVALVLVSAIEAPGSVSAHSVATIEHIQKVTATEKDSLLQSLAVEWKTALTDSSTAGLSGKEPAYWDQRASKLRRIESEPITPQKGQL